MRYRLSELAEQDLLETWLYVAADASVERADRLLEAIGQRFELLAEQPRMGRRRPEFGSDVRSFVARADSCRGIAQPCPRRTSGAR